MMKLPYERGTGHDGAEPALTAAARARARQGRSLIPPPRGKPGAREPGDGREGLGPRQWLATPVHGPRTYNAHPGNRMGVQVDVVHPPRPVQNRRKVDPPPPATLVLYGDPIAVPTGLIQAGPQPANPHSVTNAIDLRHCFILIKLAKCPTFAYR